MEYTKGKWIINFSEERNGTISVYVPLRGTVARIYTRSCDDYKANAHLIAAAPDMYEALKLNSYLLNDLLCDVADLTDWGISEYVINNLLRQINDRLSRCNKALTKAKGE